MWIFQLSQKLTCRFLKRRYSCTAAKITEQIQRLLDAKPFAPFLIKRTDGTSLSVTSPRHAMVGQYICLMDTEGLFDLVPPEAIASISLMDERPELTDQIRTLAKAKPFRAFTVVMKDGRRLEIKGPDDIRVLPTEPDRLPLPLFVVWGKHKSVPLRLNVRDVERVEIDQPRAKPKR